MGRRRPDRPDWEERARISREILRQIGALDPYADADPDEVEERLRNMNYGATNSRVSELRRRAAEQVSDDT